MKKRIAIIAIAIGVSTILKAQTDADALRYSFLDFGGTARSLGSANAYGAVGGDFSTASTNPAGFGIYRKSEFNITPGFSTYQTKSSFLGTSMNADATDFYLNNVSLTLSYLNKGKENSTSGFVGGTFAFGYNKLANFEIESFYSGFNSSSSLLDYYSSYLEGVNPSSAYSADPFGAGLAWETYLLNPNPGDTSTYYGVINGGNIQQSKNIFTDGSYDELSFSFAGNYANRLYIGATIGVPIIKYHSYTNYTEGDINSVHPDFEEFSLTNELTTRGAGINLKAGFIYKFNDYLRVGAAFHTPSLIQLNDRYQSAMESTLDISGNYSFDSPIGEYDYALVTPWRVIGSAALTIQKYGFVSVDYEFVDYSNANFNYNATGSIGESNAENSVNTSIENKYGTSSNIRLGAEAVLDIFRLRAGYAILGSPFNDGIAATDADYSKNTYTAGFGIKQSNYFIDLGFGHSTSSEYDIQYFQTNAALPNEGAVLNKSINTFLLSLGFRF